MKMKLTRIWGVGLIVALMASLLVMGAPVSAGSLSFTDETIPSAANDVLEVISDVTDIAVCADGETIYAVGGGQIVYKSTDAGVTWTSIATDVGGVTLIDADLVAVAPDNNDIFVIAKTDVTPTVYISTNGGTTFSVLGTPTETTAANYITGIAISAASAGTNYVAVSGSEDALGNVGNVWYYGLGIGGAWKETNTKTGYNTGCVSTAHASNVTLAVEFSPNFASDQVLAAVITNTANTSFEMFSLSSKVWNASGGFGSFPVNIQDSGSASITDATAASIALAPTYLGSDDVERVAFVGLTRTATTDAGIYRLKNTTDKPLKYGLNIHSIAYDGTILVAGTTGTTVWRCSDALASTPTFAPTASTKSPGGASNTVIAWAGTSLVAGTSGIESAFSVSTDNGASFNDISLIDTTIPNIADIAVSSDGSMVYMVTDNGSNISVWRKASAWQRVLSLKGTASDFIVRIAPDDPEVVYIAESGAKNVYYSKAGGDTKWYTRASRYNITDLAVESSDVAYVATAAAVSKTTNSGFTWGTSKTTLLIAGDISTITCLSEDNLLVGSDQGYVSYSTDGNSSWTKIPKQVDGAGATQVTASGLSTDGDYIYAGTVAAAADVKRWEVGQSGSVPWKSLSADIEATHGIYGIALEGSALYAVTSNSTAAGAGSDVVRTLLPTISEPSSVHWANLDGGTKIFTNTPSEMRVSTGSTKLWLCSGATLYTYTDTLSDTGITLVGPAEGAQIKVNPISGTTYDVSFTWERLSKSTKYDLWIAYDSAFAEKAITVVRGPTTSSTVSQIVGPGGTAGTNKLDYMPGITYYWKVAAAADGPIHSQWSEVRKFSIEPGAAVVPNIGSPANGGTVKTTLPAFSWSPVAGASKYEFQLAVSTNFAKAMFSTTLADTGIRPAVKLDQGMTYFWRVRATEPVLGDWSTIANFVVAEAEVVAPAAPPVVVQQVPAPIINIPAAPPAQEIVIPPAPAAPAPIAPGYIWAIIIIGAVLVIAVIVLIVRTRRTV